MKAGDTFQPADCTVDKYVHVWVIISDPEQDSDQVLIVPLTEYHPKKDTACILGPGDHPFIHKRTCQSLLDTGMRRVPNASSRESEEVPDYEVNPILEKPG
jgi:hypothetical protein